MYISRERGSTGAATVSGIGSLLDGGNFLGIGIAADQMNDSGIGKLTLQSGGTASASNIRIGSQGSIVGAGSLVGNVTDAGGIIAPGFGSSTFGHIGINGNLSLLTGRIDLDVGGISPQSHDSLQISGTANLSGGTIKIGFTNGYQPHAGDQIQLLTASGGFTGFFNPAVTFNQPSPLPYTYSNGTITFLTASPPPPPPIPLVKPQQIYLDFNQNPNALFSLEIPSESSSIAINYNKPGAGLTDSEIATIVGAVDRIYGKYNVKFTTTMPKTGPYHTIYIGGSLADISFNSGLLTPEFQAAIQSATGIARNINLGNRNPQDSAVVFSDKFIFREFSFPFCEPFISSCHDEALLAQVIAHETGHILGLFHVYDPLQLMWPQSSAAATAIGDATPLVRQDTINGPGVPSMDMTQDSDATLLCNVGGRQTQTKMPSEICANLGGYQTLNIASLSIMPTLFDVKIVLNNGLVGFDVGLPSFFIGTLSPGTSQTAYFPLKIGDLLSIEGALTEGGPTQVFKSQYIFGSDGSNPVLVAVSTDIDAPNSVFAWIIALGFILTLRSSRGWYSRQLR